MKPDLRFQIQRLDRSLLRLLDERARIQGELGAPVPMDRDDLLARHEGPLSAGQIRLLADAIDQAFGEVRRP